METNKIKKTNKTGDTVRLTYYEVFWMFLLGSVAGVLVEGLFCLIFFGQWETHVVSVFGWFNLLYGVGAALFYIGTAAMPSWSKVAKILILAAIATVGEFVCGLLLMHAYGMKAWDYSDQPLNIMGLICPLFFLVWIIAAAAVVLPFRPLRKQFKKLETRAFHIVAIVLTIFLVINFVLTFCAIARWSGRHYGKPAANRFEVFLDQTFQDEWMQSRFIEWHFLDN